MDELGERIAYVKVLGVDFAMLGEVEVLLGDEYALYIKVSPPFLFEPSTDVHIPRKRYSWIFLRSALGMSLRNLSANVFTSYLV